MLWPISVRIRYLHFALFSHNFWTKTLRIPEYLTIHIHVNTFLGSPKHVLKQTYRSKLTMSYLIYSETDSSCTTVLWGFPPCPRGRNLTRTSSGMYLRVKFIFQNLIEMI